MWQNLTAARLVGHYGVVKDMSPMVTDEIENYTSFTITRLGLADTETFTVSIQALDEHIVEVGDDIEYDNMELLETASDSISYMLDAGIENGTIYQYLLSINNGQFVVSDTITKVYGIEVLVFEDDCENLDNWTSNKWNTTDKEYYSPSFSITDSPNGDYQHNENSSITLDTTVSLTGASVAFLRFWAKWDIEEGYDYVQLSAKEEGSSNWTPLHGKFASYGNYYLGQDEPVYDGIQNEWVQEEISLVEFADKNITLRFRLNSDSYVKADGFYFDALSISVISAATGIKPNKKHELFVSDAYPNPAMDAFSIQYDLINNDNAVFELFNLSGNKLKSVPINNKKGVLNIKINDLQDGIYYYRLKNGSRVSKSSKLIKL